MRLALGALAVWACATPARAANPERDSYEAGVDTPAEVPQEVSDARDDLRQDLGSQALLSVDETSGAVRFLAQLDGYLDDAPSADPVGAARGYLADQAEAFGVERSDIADLRVSERQTGGDMQSVEFTQSVDGVPIVDSSLEAHLDDEGRLVAITGGLVPDPELESSEPDVPRSEALEAATDGVGGEAYGGRLVAYSAGDELRLAWRVMVNASSTGHYDTLVDAETGEVVRRYNLVKFAGQALLFDNYPGASTGGTESLGSLTPWLDPSPTRLSGPSVHAFADVEDEVPGTGASPVFTPPPGRETTPDVTDDFLFPFGDFVTADYDCGLAFRCSWDPKTPNSWAADSDQAATQLFYYVNLFHDHLRDTDGIEFTDQLEGTDRVVAQAQDGADVVDDPDLDTPGYPGIYHVNNANMTVLPRDSSSGTPGALMQMYLWDPKRDLDEDEEPNYRPVSGGDDPSLVFHEYTHALNNRLVTDALGYGALNGPQAGAIDEGTADWFALDYLVGDGVTPYMPDDLSDPDVTLARYEVDGPTGLRTQAIDCPVGANDPACPNAGGSAGAGGYTYGDFARIRGGAEVHDDGEIWAQTLWDLRRRLLLDYGASDGLERARRLVTNGLELSPPNPSFLDMRNAILLGNEQAGTDGVPASVIWQVFAQRGMGYAASAVDTDDVHPLQDFTTPPAAAAGTGSVSGTVRDVNTGAPIAGALVAFAGHDSGLGGEDLSTQTKVDGSYRINGVPARTWSFLTIAGANGYDRAASPNVPITGGKLTTRNVSLRRNWALASGGASIRSWTGPNFSGSGCGPGSTIDGSRRGVWSTYGTAPGSAMPGAKEQVIALPAPISLGEIRIDPSSGCGDSAGAALAGYLVQASKDATTYTTVAQGTFGGSNVGKANPVTLIARPGGVRYLKLRALSTQGSSPFMDVAEIQVFAPLPAAPPTPPPPTPPTPPTAKLTLLTKQAKLSRKRRFVLKVSGPKGALVRTQFTVRIRPRGKRARKIVFARAAFRLSASTGRARVVVKVSKRTLRRVRSLKPRLGVVARAAGQRRTGTLVLKRPRPRRA